MKHNMERAKEAGIDYYAVVVPAAGATYVPDNNTED